MEIISTQQYDNLCREAQVLQEDGFGIKVLSLADGQMVKMFRRKRLLSSALFRPYAKRFQKNAVRLAALGIKTVKVNRVCHCPSLARHLVFYSPVSGPTFRQFLVENPCDSGVLEGFSGFLAELHAKGIHFHSLHFGNVIVLPGAAGFALIDIADLSFRSAPLSVGLRIRNFRHFLRYREDRNSLEDFGLAKFIRSYARKAELTDVHEKFLQHRLSQKIKMK